MKEPETNSMNPVNLLVAACIALTFEICILATILGLTVQENGRLQGEINRMESQLRNIRVR